MKNLMLPLRPKATFVLLFLGSLSFLASCVSDYNNNCDGVTTKFHDLFMDPDNNEAKAIKQLTKSGRNTVSLPYLSFLQKKRSESKKHDLSQTCNAHKCPILMRALEEEWTDFIKCVFENGDYTWGDINYQNRDGYTPLILAIKIKNPESVKLLLTHGAKKGINLQDNDGCTALMWACMMENTLKTVEELLKYGANTNLQNNDGRTALMYAAYKNNPALAKLLCKYGADVDLKDNADKTAQTYADEAGHEAVADFLKEEKRK